VQGLIVAIMWLAGLAAFAAPQSARVALSGPLAEWKSEIESLGPHKIVLARVYYDTVRRGFHLPRDAPERPLIVEFLRDPNFLKQFVAMHAATVRRKQDGRTIHIILLNMGRQPEWGGHEEVLIAQELGRVWLYANDYAEPAYDGTDQACLGIQAADLLQRRIIRRELRRRGFDFDAYRLPLLEAALERMEKAAARPAEEIPTCELMSKLVLWVDVRLGAVDRPWPHRKRFLQALRRLYPILERTANDLYRELAPLDLAGDRKTYERTLQTVLHTMYGFVRLVLKRGGIRYEMETIPPPRKPPEKKPGVAPLPDSPPAGA